MAGAAELGGGLVHGTAASALRGCPCAPCRCRLDELVGEEQPAQLELPSVPAERSPLAVAAGAPAGWAPLPWGLMPVVPACAGEAIAGVRARQEVLARAGSPAEAARQLLTLGLARPVAASAGRPAIPAESLSGPPLPFPGFLSSAAEGVSDDGHR